METLYRHWLILNMIPRYPQKIDGAMIEGRLRAEGDETTTRRTIQRDLEKLSTLFPIACHDSTKPYGWYWIKDAPTFAMPGMDPVTALTFHLAEKHLARIFPRSAMSTLQPYLDLAGRVLDRQSDNRLQKWPDKVKIISRGQPLGAPEIKPEVIEVVYEALLLERQFRGWYRRRAEKDLREHIVNPLGLVVQDQTTYLVACLWDYEKPVMLALHRMERAEMMAMPCRMSENFDLQEYLDSGVLQFPEGDKPIKLEVLFDPYAGAHLLEAPLSSDQTFVEQKKDGRLLIRATVADTAQLRWWLLGFGESVEVVGPTFLRSEFYSIAVEACRRYRPK